MKLIIGIGNPEPEYSKTRHNSGLMVIDELLKNKKAVKGLLIKKSGVFMNESGKFVKQLLKANPKLSESDLYVIHDDLDIPLGTYKIQFGRGPKDHNGLRSIDDELGTDQYWHVRIGVDNRPLDNRPMGEEYVLQNFTDRERETLNKTINEVCKKLVT